MLVKLSANMQMINHIQVSCCWDLLIAARCIFSLPKILRREIVSWSPPMNLIKIYGHLILKPKIDNMECVICKAGNMYEGKVMVTLEKMDPLF